MATSSSFTGGLLTGMVAVLCCILAVNSNQLPCHTSDQTPYRWYGTKTAYSETLANMNRSESPGSRDSVEAGCAPVMVWHLNRHGYRYPGDDDIELFNTLLPNIRDGIINNATVSSQFCAGDLAALRDWKPRMIPSDDSKLVETGYQEMMRIARRFREKYPSLLNATLEDLLANFTIRHSDKERTRMSAKAFVKGLLKQPGMSGSELDGLVNQVPMVVHRKGKDLVIRFYDACQKFIQTVDEKPIPELVKFLDGPIMKKTRAVMSSRLGLQGVINQTVAEALWLACASEYAIYGITQDATVRNSSAAPWCSIFTQDELEVFEYVADLEYYYVDSYGHKINYEQTCPLVKDLVGSIRNATYGSDFFKGVLRFGHSQTVVPLFSALGLFKDTQPFTANNYESQKNRKLRTSFIDPMASNINFVVYKCGETYKFKMHVMETEIVLPGCSDVLCDVSTLMNTIGKIADTCDFNEICKWPIDPGTGGATKAGDNKITPLFTLLAFFILNHFN